MLIKEKSRELLKKNQMPAKGNRSEVHLGLSKFNISLRQGGGKEEWILSLVPWKEHAKIKFRGTDGVEVEALSGIEG